MTVSVHILVNVDLYPQKTVFEEVKKIQEIREVSVIKTESADNGQLNAFIVGRLKRLSGVLETPENVCPAPI